MKKQLLTLLLLISTSAYSQNTFVKTYGSYRTDFANAMCLTPGKGYAMGVLAEGFPSTQIDMLLLKTDHNGVLEWQRAYNPGVNVSINGIDATNDGGYITAATLQLGTYSNTVMVSKFNSVGQPQWSQRLQTPRNDYYTRIKQLKNGGFLVSVITDSIGGYRETLLYALNTDGTLKWSKRYTSIYNLTPENTTELSNGDIAVIAATNGYAPNMGVMENAVVFLIDSAGNLKWARMFATEYDDVPMAITSNNNDDILIAGKTYFINTQWDTWLIVVDKNGHTMHTSFHNAGTDTGEMPRAIDITNDGGCILFGDLGQWEQRDLFTIKFDSNFNYEWSKRYLIDVNHTNYAFDGYHTEDGGYAFAGDNGIASDRQPFLIKTDSVGHNNCNSLSVAFSPVAENFSESSLQLTEFETAVMVSAQTLVPVTNTVPMQVRCQRLFPIPDFSYTQTESCNTYCVNFTNLSLNDSTLFNWTFDGSTTPVSVIENPTGICFTDTGSFAVQLSITNDVGTRAIQKNIHVYEYCAPEEDFFIPNVFTPNGDNVNDLFYIKGLPKYYDLTVRNRWGQKVHEQSNTPSFWNGDAVSAGLYYYVLTINTEKESKKTYSGTVSIIR